MTLPVPDACTLPTAARPLRLAELDTLFATAECAVQRVSPTHARLRLAGPYGLEATVRDLASREAQCCPFVVFTVAAEPAPDGAVVVLGVEVPAEHADLLTALAQRADAATSSAAPHRPARAS